METVIYKAPGLFRGFQVTQSDWSRWYLGIHLLGSWRRHTVSPAVGYTEGQVLIATAVNICFFGLYAYLANITTSFTIDKKLLSEHRA